MVAEFIVAKNFWVVLRWQFYHMTLWITIVSMTKHVHDEIKCSKGVHCILVCSGLTSEFCIIVLPGDSMSCRAKCLTFRLRRRPKVTVTFWGHKLGQSNIKGQRDFAVINYRSSFYFSIAHSLWNYFFTDISKYYANYQFIALSSDSFSGTQVDLPVGFPCMLNFSMYIYIYIIYKIQFCISMNLDGSE